MCLPCVKIWKILVILPVKLADMTNLHIKTALISVAILALAITGCKKDEEYGSLVLDSYSVDFEWGQTKEIGFTSNHLRSYGTPTVPTGWTCTRNGNKYIITAPGQGISGTELSGKIGVSATSKDNTALKREITVAIKIAEEIAAGANSIIITEPGKRFKFYARRRGNETSGTSLAAATRATRVWTTSKTAVINVSLEGDYLYFSTGASDVLEEANTVVAVADSKGIVLWSWHIWVTDFDPAAEPDFIGGMQVMNRNLGAFANSGASAAEAALSYGLYYQWGRKDPFVGPAVWNSTVPRSLYNNSGYNATHSYVVSTDAVDMDGDKKNDGVAGTLEFATAFPNTFIAGAEADGFDWQSGTHRNDLWKVDSKTIYDPCPAGWRVAPPTIWAGFTTTGTASGNPAEFSVEGEYAYGWTFKVDDGLEYHPPLDPDTPLPDHYLRIFFPAAGRRSFSPSLAKPDNNFTNVVNDGEAVGSPVGFYWSAAYPSSERTTALAFRRDFVNPAATPEKREQWAPAGGFPLRCVAE